MCFLEETYKWIPDLRNEPQNYLETCKNISDFLSKVSPERTECLKKLNNEMAALIQERQSCLEKSYNNEQIIEAFQNPEKTREDENLKKVVTHVLSDVLSKNEAKHNFSLFSKEGRPSGQAVTYLAFIEPDLFREQLQKGRQWKDPTVPGEHGEFTHRIQWYMITNACDSENQPFIKAPNDGWLAFYQWLGTIRHGECKQLNDKEVGQIKTMVLKDTGNKEVSDKVVIGLKNCENIGRVDRKALIDLIADALIHYEFSVHSNDNQESKDKYITRLASDIIDLIIRPCLKESFELTQGFSAEAWLTTNAKNYDIKYQDWWKLGLWDALADRNPADRPYIFCPYNTANNLDFRAPENFAPYLRKDIEDCDLLKSFFVGRNKKREPINNVPVLGDYWSRKLYNLSVEKLDETRQEILAGLIVCSMNNIELGWLLGRLQIVEPPEKIQQLIRQNEPTQNPEKVFLSKVDEYLEKETDNLIQSLKSLIV